MKKGTSHLRPPVIPVLKALRWLCCDLSLCCHIFSGVRDGLLFNYGDVLYCHVYMDSKLNCIDS